MNSFRSKPVGWRGESHRHYLAAKGIKTVLKDVRSTQFVRDDELNKLFEVRDTVEPVPVAVPEDKIIVRSGSEAIRFPKVSGEKLAELRRKGLPLPTTGMDVIDDPNVRVIVGESSEQKAVVVPKSVERFHSSLDEEEVKKGLKYVSPEKESLLSKLRHKVRVESDEEVPVELVEKVIEDHGVPLHEFAREGVDEEKFGPDVNVTRARAFQKLDFGPAREAFDVLEKRGLLKQMEGRTVVRGEVFDRKPKKGEMSEAELLRQTLQFAQDSGGEKSVKQNLKVLINQLKDAEVAGLRVETRTHPSYLGQFTQTGKLRKKPPMVEVKRVVTREVGLPKERDLPLAGQEKDPVLASRAFFDRQIAIKELQALL